MAYYPIFLELKGRPCLVIGGGPIACRKAQALLSCAAKVTVVSPQLGAGFQRLAQARKIVWRKRLFRPGDLTGMQLAISATDDQAVNKQVSRLAQRQGIWVNVVDQPRLCSFILSSVVRRGKLVLAISTGGASPALAKWIRRDLERRYSPEFGRSLAGMARARKQVMGGGVSPRRRKKLFEQALRAYLRVIKRGRVDLAPGRRV